MTISSDQASTNGTGEVRGNADRFAFDRWSLLLVAAAAIALFVRLPGLSTRPLRDEATTWLLAEIPWGDFWRGLYGFEANMAFYYVVMRWWAYLGSHEIALRGLSVLLGVATVIAVYALGTRLFSRRAGLIAALFLALSAYHIRWSQEARSYALVVFLLVLATLFFVAWVKSPRSRAEAVGYVIAGTLACYSHFLAVFVLASHWLWFLGHAGIRALFSRVAVWGTLAVLIAPAGLYAVLHDAGQIDWISPLSRYQFISTMIVFAGGSRALLALYVLLGALAVYFGVRSGRETDRAGMTLMLLWFVVALGAMTLMSAFKPMFVDRYLLMIVIAPVVLAGFAVDRLLATGPIAASAGAVAGLAILALSLHESLQQYEEAQRHANPLREMTSYLREHKKPGDTIVFFPAATAASYEYYTARLEHLDRPLMDPDVVIPNLRIAPTGESALPAAAEMASARDRSQRFWLVLNLNAIRVMKIRQDQVRLIESTLEERDALIGKQRIAGSIVIERYERRDR